MTNAGTIAKPYGWVFFYDSRRYLENPTLENAILGNTPVLVLAATGELISLGTRLPWADALAEIESVRGLL